MTKLSRVLWTISVIFIVIALITLSLGIVAVGITIAVILNLYRLITFKKRSMTKRSKMNGFNKQGYSYVDVHDVTPSESIKQLTEEKAERK